MSLEDNHSCGIIKNVCDPHGCLCLIAELGFKSVLRHYKKHFCHIFWVHPSGRLDTQPKYFAQSHSYTSGSPFIKLSIHHLFILPAYGASSGVFCISEKVFNITSLSEAKHFKYPTLKLFLFFFACFYSSFPHLPFKRFCY